MTALAFSRAHPTYCWTWHALQKYLQCKCVCYAVLSMTWVGTCIVFTWAKYYLPYTAVSPCDIDFRRRSYLESEVHKVSICHAHMCVNCLHHTNIHEQSSLRDSGKETKFHWRKESVYLKKKQVSTESITHWVSVNHLKWRHLLVTFQPGHSGEYGDLTRIKSGSIFFFGIPIFSCLYLIHLNF